MLITDLDVNKVFLLLLSDIFMDESMCFLLGYMWIMLRTYII